MDSMMNVQRNASGLILCWLGLLLTTPGCGMRSRQADAEARLAIDIVKWLKLHDVVSAEPVTNLAQVFPVLPGGYPYHHHEVMLRFGRQAGFATNIAEKYAFFSPRFNHKLLTGEAMGMSTQPFMSGSSRSSRVFITMVGTSYVYRMIPEELAQEVLRETKPHLIPLGEIRTPASLPVGIPTRAVGLREHLERFEWSVANGLGQDSTSGIRILLRCAFLVVLAATLWVCGRCWRTRR